MADIKLLCYLIATLCGLILAQSHHYQTCVSHEDVCGKSNGGTANKIFYGEVATRNEFPWMVSLMHRSYFREFRHACGASLISNRWILTAAHCILTLNHPPVEDYQVALSEHNITDPNEPGERKVGVKRYIVHREAQRLDVPRKDWALMELAEYVNFSPILKPICLPSFGEGNFVGENAVTAGWGDTEKYYNSEVLLKIDTQIKSTDDCGDEPPESLDEDMTCAQNPDNPDKTTCHGDSGGPLMVKDPYTGNYKLAGVTSWGAPGCLDASHPPVFATINDKALAFIYVNTGVASACP